MLPDQALQGALFGGCGFVPDIAALQAWLEAAWAAGYDAAGAEQLGNAVQGTHKWVGTTEAATLLRLFGMRAFVVDFRGASKAFKLLGTTFRAPSMAPGVDVSNCHLHRTRQDAVLCQWDTDRAQVCAGEATQAHGAL